MKKFKLDLGCATDYVNSFSRNLLNFDIPDVYYRKDNRWVLIIDRRFCVLTAEYCYLPKEDRKKILDFLIKSARAFFKWTYIKRWSMWDKKSLEQDVDDWIQGFYREAFMDNYKEELKTLGYPFF